MNDRDEGGKECRLIVNPDLKLSIHFCVFFPTRRKVIINVTAKASIMNDMIWIFAENICLKQAVSIKSFRSTNRKEISRQRFEPPFPASFPVFTDLPRRSRPRT